MIHKKITVGFVIQNFVTVGGKHICTNQEFVAGDTVDYENENGETITIDTKKEQYQTFDMVNPPTIKSNNGLVFTCPFCKENRLECCEDGNYSSEIIDIDVDGDFSYGKIDADGRVSRFKCLNCGFVLKGKDGKSLDYNEEVIEWIKTNCEQPAPNIDSRYEDDNVDK